MYLPWGPSYERSKSFISLFMFVCCSMARKALATLFVADALEAFDRKNYMIIDDQ